MLKSKAMKWVRALRSGNFIQGAGMLRSKEEGSIKHCCLGVLAELNGFPDKDIDGHALLSGKMPATCGMKSSDGTPEGKDGVAEMIKIKIPLGRNSFSDLADANDAGVSFKRIATWIEKNYKLL